MAPAHDKKSCINNEKYKYSGKEMSPLGLGIAAEAENVGKQMIGRNGKNWIVALKNQNKVWMRAPEPETLKKEQPILPKKTYVKGSPSGVKHDDEEDEDCSSLDLDKEEEEDKTPRPTPKTAPKSSSAHSPKKKLMHKTPEPEPESEPEEEEHKSEEEPEEEEHKSEEEEKPEPKPKATPKPKAKPKEKEVEYETEEQPVKPKRKSHAVKASEFDVGYSKTEEGITYVVKEGPDNVKKWVKQKDTKSSSSSTTTKKRGPTAYNKFIGKQMIELRKITPGLHTTEYMRLALELWKAMTPEEKAAVKD